MTRYFVDFRNGDQLYREDECSQLATLEQAKQEAIRMLPQVAKDALPSGEHWRFIATVRDDKGTVWFQAILMFDGKQLGVSTI